MFQRCCRPGRIEKTNTRRPVFPLNSSATLPIELADGPAVLSRGYSAIRDFTKRICSTLEREDYVLQSMTDASPVRWHLAHTTWFFETFVLSVFDSNYTPYDSRFAYLFNSYYVQAGERFSRPERGLLSRPTVDEVYAYRHYVDSQMVSLLGKWEESNPFATSEIYRVVTIGLNHEQQHQELILTDIKHALALNPLQPAVFEASFADAPPLRTLEWTRVPEGIYEIGADDDNYGGMTQAETTTGTGAATPAGGQPDSGHAPGGRAFEQTPFHFDNECPKHKQYIAAYEVANRPISNGEFMEFVSQDGYGNQLLWLDKAWSTVSAEKWRHPLYWYEKDDAWYEYTLYGARPLDMNAPLSHVSYYEADAFTRWAGYRLPSEFEWEIFARSGPSSGHMADEFLFHPSYDEIISDSGIESAEPKSDIRCIFGTVWEWTRSQYAAYPGYRPESGALGEYNGKFMCDQFVLRGGSVATHSTHIRSTYRNFFPGYARWQFSGIRPARDQTR